MEDIISSILVAACFIGIPWIILHYITRWKTAASLTTSDENLMEDLYELSRRLEDRLCTVERILTAENPAWRSIACETAPERIADRSVSNEPRRIGR